MQRRASSTLSRPSSPLIFAKNLHTSSSDEAPGRGGSEPTLWQECSLSVRKASNTSLLMIDTLDNCWRSRQSKVLWNLPFFNGFPPLLRTVSFGTTLCRKHEAGGSASKHELTQRREPAFIPSIDSSDLIFSFLSKAFWLVSLFTRKPLLFYIMVLPNQKLGSLIPCPQRNLPWGRNLSVVCPRFVGPCSISFPNGVTCPKPSCSWSKSPLKLQGYLFLLDECIRLGH